jgi:hypothetical protein
MDEELSEMIDRIIRLSKVEFLTLNNSMDVREEIAELRGKILVRDARICNEHKVFLKKLLELGINPYEQLELPY